jgi:hypothetical protein
MNTVHESDNTSDNFPIVGKGATIINFQSKYAYEVLDVNSNEDEVIIKRYLPTKVDEDNPSSQDQTYIFKTLGLNHIHVKKINGIWKMENHFTKRWEYIKIVFGIKVEYHGVVA